MPRFTFKIEINLAHVLADRATAHLNTPYEQEYDQALRFLYNALHQHRGKARTFADKIGKAMQEDQLARIRRKHYPEEVLRTDQTEWAIYEALVAFGVWDHEKQLSPVFMRKLGLQDQ